MNITKDFLENGLWKVAIIGSRTVTDKSLVEEFIDSKIDKIGLVISGGCVGPDRMAESHAKLRGIPVLSFSPKWRDVNGVYDNGAGFKRNKFIVREADIVVAFLCQKSKGTSNSIDLAKYYKKQLIVFDIDPVFQTVIKEERF